MLLKNLYIGLKTKPTNKLMKRLSLYLFLILFILPTPSQADDIRDFQIEGMSVGDSLLDFMTENEIEKNKLNYETEQKNKFYTVNYTGKKVTYKVVEITLKKNDKKYEIYTVRGGFFIDDLKECKNKKNKIVKEIKSLFQDSNFYEGEQKHYYYKDSTQYISQFTFKPPSHEYDNIRVECLVFGKKDKKEYGFQNNISVMSQSGIVVDDIKAR